MDATSVPGMILIVACFLTAKGLVEAQVEACEKVISRLENLVNYSGTLKLLPHFTESWISVQENKMLLEAFSPILKEVGIQLKRPGHNYYLNLFGWVGHIYFQGQIYKRESNESPTEMQRQIKLTN